MCVFVCGWREGGGGNWEGDVEGSNWSAHYFMLPNCEVFWRCISSLNILNEIFFTFSASTLLAKTRQGTFLMRLQILWVGDQKGGERRKRLTHIGAIINFKLFFFVFNRYGLATQELALTVVWIIKLINSSILIDDCSKCCVCNKEASRAHKCSSCLKVVHAICEKHPEDTEGYDASVICNNCKAIQKSKVMVFVIYSADSSDTTIKTLG